MVIDEVYYGNFSPDTLHRTVVPTNNTLAKPPPSDRNPASPFLDLLKSPVVTITPHVQHIELFYTDLDGGFRSHMVLLSSFSALRSVSLELNPSGHNMAAMIRDILPFLRSLEHLKKLKLTSWTWAAFEQARDCICACRSLEELEMVGAVGATDFADTTQFSQDNTPLSSPPGRLKNLKVDSFASELDLLLWLESAVPSMPITILQMNIWPFIKNSLNASCGRLLKKLASSLVELTIEHRGRLLLVEESLFGDINLGYNTGLKTLALTECMPKVLFDLINQVSSSSIREINFTVPVYESYWRQLPYFEKIDSMLQRPNFAQLETVNIEQRGISGEPSANIGWVEEKMRLSVARGIIKHKLMLL
ncbi:hypothetical protein HWV62_1228 [Athelia sp. TMB]|nr:hypothetical protein HWV62_1228 [Athelia sp. TMB]